MPYIVKSTALTGAYNSAAAEGIPSLLIERGSRGLWSRDEVDLYKEDVYNLLSFLHMVKDKVKEQKGKIIFDKVFYPQCDIEGCWYPEINLEQKIKKDQRLGLVKDIFGNILKSYYAEANGIVLYQTCSLAIQKGDILLAYGAI